MAKTKNIFEKHIQWHRKGRRLMLYRGRRRTYQVPPAELLKALNIKLLIVKSKDNGTSKK